MQLLLIGDEPTDEIVPDALRRMIRTLHFRTSVRIAALWRVEGPESAAWREVVQWTVVVDHLRRWPLAVSVDRRWGAVAGGRLRGARLRVQLRRLPQPDVVLLVGGEGADLVDLLPHRPHRVVLFVLPGRPPSQSALERADVVITAADLGPATGSSGLRSTGPAPVAVALGADGSEIRVAALDTRRADRRAELDLAASDRLVVLVGDDDAVRSWTGVLEGAGLAAVTFGRFGPSSGVRSSGVVRLGTGADLGAADAVVLVGPDGEDAAVSAILAGTPVVTLTPLPRVGDRDGVWVVDADLSEPSALVAAVVDAVAAAVVPGSRERRMEAAAGALDTTRLASEFLDLLAGRTTPRPAVPDLEVAS